MRAADYAAGETGSMLFLLRMAFWLSLVLILLPTGSAQRAPAGGDVGASEVISAGSATVQDMRGFCIRQPDACTIGSQVAVSLGYRAQAGAKMLYDFLTEALAPRDTGSLPRGGAARGSMVKSSSEKSASAKPGSDKSALERASQDTLNPVDLTPAWRGPQSHKDAKRPT
jgi:hypothetical protein